MTIAINFYTPVDIYIKINNSHKKPISNKPTGVTIKQKRT